MSELSRSAKALLKKTDDNSEKEDKPIFQSYIETSDYILEQIQGATDATSANSAREVRFIKYDKKLGTTEEVEDFENENKLYKPINNELTYSISLSGGVQEYNTISNLIKRIRDFYNYNFQVPAKFEQILPYLCLFTWVYEKFPFVPYINFVGLTSTGKTTAMEVFGSLCYKTLDVSGSITMASIFRTTTIWRGTLLLDEFDNIGEEARQMISFLKSGVSDRAVLRVEGDKVREVKAYLVKCPKIFTSEKPVTDAGLQSRIFVIPMEKNKRKVPLYRLNKYKKETEELKRMLLLWRLRNLNKIDFEDIEFGFEELSGLESRVQQVITPIYYLADDETKKNILIFAQEQQKETLRQRREAEEGIIFTIIYDLYNENQELMLSEITAEFNKKAIPFKLWTNTKVSNVIRKILGFETERVGHNNITMVIPDKNKLEDLCQYYGLTPLAPIAVVAPVANGESKQIKVDQEKLLDQIEETQKESSDNLPF